ncbi:MAG TPA: dipeptidase [Gemmatimonadales bacterium]|nr:dipeptidase [Gemmatimonadales bacterium]
MTRLPLTLSLFPLTLFLMTNTTPVAGQSNDAALEHARKLLESAPLIDGHNDLPWEIRESKTAPRNVAAYDLRKRAPKHTDLARLAAGKVGAQFWSIYVPGEIKDSGYARVQLEQFDIARRMIARYPDRLALALTADDIERNFKRGRIGSLLGMEGGHVIENSLGALRAYYALGARYLTLTHNVTLDWADAALDTARHQGLTEFGKEVVREMNRLGMLVDLSHVSPGVMSDALDVTESPVIFSHSSARALTNHPRNVPDSILARLPRNGGVVMVTFVPAFVSPEAAVWDTEAQRERERLKSTVSDTAERRRLEDEWKTAHPQPQATLAQVADHIEHVRKVAGVDHVGIGSDFDGIDTVPEGLEDVSMFPNLFAELIRRGWSDADLKKLAGGNILRVLRAAEATAARLQKSRPPSTKTIEELDGLRTRAPGV